MSCGTQMTFKVSWPLRHFFIKIISRASQGFISSLSADLKAAQGILSTLIKNLGYIRLYSVPSVQTSGSFYFLSAFLGFLRVFYSLRISLLQMYDTKNIVHISLELQGQVLCTLKITNNSHTLRFYRRMKSSLHF